MIKISNRLENLYSKYNYIDKFHNSIIKILTVQKDTRYKNNFNFIQLYTDSFLVYYLFINIIIFYKF